MAINLLGNLPAPTTNYSSLSKQTVNAAPATPSGNVLNSVGGFLSNAYNKGQQILSQGTQSAQQRMGVTAKSPATSVPSPATTLPRAQVATTPSATQTPAPGLNQPGGVNSMGTHILTQAELDAQNATAKQNPPVQANSGLLYDASGNLKANPNAAPGTAGSADPTVTQSSNQIPAVGATNSQTPNGMNGPYNQTTPVSYGGLIQQAANVASAPSADYLAQQAQANQYNQELETLREQEAQAYADNANNPIPLTFQQGRAQVLQSQYGQRENALASAYQGAAGLVGAANTQQGQEQTGLLGAAGAAAPVQVSPGNYLASPLNGGASSAAAGQQQGIQAATNWAIAQQNMAQGKNYQGISQELSNAIQTMAPIGQKLTSFITATGQNPATSPLVNEQIGKVNAQLYPAQAATLNAAVNDIRSYAVQILGSQSGANPTDVTNAVNSFDFSKFSAADLQSFLQDLNNLGNTRLSQAQSAMNASYGANNTVGTPAAGMTATDQGAFNTGTMSPSSMGSNLGKALLGSIASVGGAAVDKTGSAISSVPAGVIGGAAEAYFATP